MRTKKAVKIHRIYWLTALALTILATVGWMRFQQSLHHWYYLIGLKLWPHPLYLAISGGLIGIGYSLALIFHLARKSFTPFYLRVLGITLLIWLWIDRIFIGMRDSFYLLLTGTILITVVMIALDIFIFHKNRYPEKEDNDG